MRNARKKGGVFRKKVFEAGVARRNPRIPSNEGFLRESETWSLDRLLDFQHRSLAELIDWACANSPFHRERLSGAVDSGTDLLGQMIKLPLTDKQMLRDNADRIQNRVPGQSDIASSTSGSSGKPLVFRRNLDWDAWHNASVFRGYRWHGIVPWQRNGYLWGYSIPAREMPKVRLLDELQNRFRMFSYDERDMTKFCRKLRSADYLEGYASMVNQLAVFLDTRPELNERIDLRFIKGTSEKVFESYQQRSERVFGRRMVGEYGSAEGGIMAFGCPAGKMHLNMETMIAETVNGRMVVTNLVSKSFPVIRYDIGDHVDIDFSERCDCGRQGYVLREVTGRIGRTIRGRTKAFPSMTLYHVFKTLSKEHAIDVAFQGVQERQGELVVRLERSLHENERKRVSAELERFFSQDMTIELIEAQNLAARGRKTRDFVSLLEDDEER